MLKTIKQGSTGREVVIAKYLTGYQKMKADNKFDAAFVAKVCAWQRQHGLTPDGIIGPNTWQALANAAPTCSTSKNKDREATCALQMLLDGIDADGIYGPKTMAAVLAYQAAKGLGADGICGPKTWAALVCGTAAKNYAKPVDYKQYDSRWGSKMYSAINKKTQTMKSSGCGPTAAADVLATLVDESITPWTLAEIALKKGFRTESNGTAWAFFKHLAGLYGLKFVQTSNLSTLKACLDAGGYVVCSMGKGYWTSAGHYICAWKYDASYIYANDPASTSRTKQKQSTFLKERKQFFCFYPEA